MTAGNDAPLNRRFRAPRGNGSILIDPPPAEVRGLLAANIQRRRAHRCNLHGRSLDDLSTAGRQELVELAHRYTASYRKVDVPHECKRLLVAGHQPELFHPGVWFKNFALNRLARENDALPINLVIDNDTVKHVSLRVPGGSLEAPLVESIPFDVASDEIPYEERDIEDRTLFADFGERASTWVHGLVPNPLLEEYWPLVRARTNQTRNLGQCLSQARHQLEAAWGLQTLEIPQSQVCALQAFHWFTSHVLVELPRFRDVYNDAVNAYRRLNHVRSANHPVPNLAIDGEWLEAPYWLWTSAAPRRRRLFVRRHAAGMTLTDRRRIEFELPLADGADPTHAIEALAGLAAQGIKLRSRALVTTLFARLVLSDLFVHGIGGAKYDQLTDELIRRFFGLEPPDYLVISATLHLASATQGVAPDEVRHLDQELRDLEYHPERYIAALHDWDRAPVDVARWLALKSQWLQTEQTRENGRERCHAIRAANEALQAWIEPRRRDLLRRRHDAMRLSRATSVLTSREYGFCLYPADTLRNFLVAV